MQTDYKPLVEKINANYERLSQESNDSLRHRMLNMGKLIRGSQNPSQAMDDHLIEVFAIVKLFAKRLTAGNVIFHTEPIDKELTEEGYTFLRTNGDETIYSNQWFIKDEPYTWKMVHYDEQILGGILLHKGMAIQMATGEGKTLVGTLPTVLNALSGEGVHLITCNEYLARRDCEIMRPLYAMLGLRVGCLQNQDHAKAYQADITYGASSTFIFDYLRDHLAVAPEQCVQRKHAFAILDEIDSILIDGGVTPHVISSGPYEDVKTTFMQYHPLFMEFLALPSPLYECDPLHDRAEFTEEGKQWLSEKTGIPELFKYQRIYQVPNYQQLDEQGKEQLKTIFQVQNVLTQFLLAYVIYKKDIHYIVYTNEKGRRSINIIDEMTGRLKPTHRYEHGLHTALEIKEKCFVKREPCGQAAISTKNYYRLYNKLAGMSGTIITLSDELKADYGLTCEAVPTHRPVIRIDHPIQVYQTLSDRNQALVAKVRGYIEAGRPVLIGCNTIDQSETLAQCLKQANLSCQLLNAKNSKDEFHIIQSAGQPGQVTVGTTMVGRGTDIQLDRASIQNGGLAVIGTTMYASVRNDLQLRGRSGRQGEPGSSEFLVSLEDEILSVLPCKVSEQLRTLSKESSQSSLPDTTHFFLQAQQIQENYAKTKREKQNRKDDIVAPFRTSFYEQRNNILFDADKVEELLHSIIETQSRQELDNHILKILNIVRSYVRSLKKDTLNIKIIPIPLAYKQQVFSLDIDMEKLLYHDDYFTLLYNRSVILYAYDIYWKKFIEHLLDNLDEHEIDCLNDELQNLQKTLSAEIKNRLLYTTVPITIEEPEGDKFIATEVKEETTHTVKTIAPTDPCPCSSGKSYGECHGNAIRRILKIGRAHV